MSIPCPACQHENPDDTQFCGKCATPLSVSESESLTKTLEAPVVALKTGQTFAGRYQISEELGKGGMGTVYRALDQELREEVALKIIRPEIAADKKIIERFKIELKDSRPQPLPSVRYLHGWQRQAGDEERYIFGLPVENGRLGDRGERRLKTAVREIVREHALGVRITPNQDLLLCHVPAAFT